MITPLVLHGPEASPFVLDKYGNMQGVSMYDQLHVEWADILYKEVMDDHSPWFHPTRRDGTFDQAFQKFMTGNLNCYSLKNMLATSIEPEIRNPRLLKCYGFADLVRQSQPNGGPFGKMALWKVGPGKKLLSHRDNFPYHHHIYRIIFNISDHGDDVEIIMNKDRVHVVKGSLFPFRPATEEHSFENKSDKDWYFLAFDFWDKDKHADLINTIDLTGVLNNPDRIHAIGNVTEKCLSNH